MSTVMEHSQALEATLSETHATLQLVSFRLADEVYGIEITKVREIILISEITRIPQAPHFVRGLINLRNAVIPVIDLRALFGLPEGDVTDDSRIMVLQAGGMTLGIVVDAVHEVLRVKHDQISAPPTTVSGSSREYLAGLVRLDTQLLILLDIEKTVGGEVSGTLAGL